MVFVRNGREIYGMRQVDQIFFKSVLFLSALPPSLLTHPLYSQALKLNFFALEMSAETFVIFECEVFAG